MNTPKLLSFLAAGLALVPLTFPASPAHAQDNRARSAADPTLETTENGRGRINYAAGVVKATGYGATPTKFNSPAQARLMALGAARADALRTLAMTVSSIQVTATTRVKNYELQKDVVETKLSALLRSPRIVSETVQADGTAVVVVELPMYGPGSVASVILPEVLTNPDAPAPSYQASSASQAAPVVISGVNDTGGAVPPGGGAGASNGTFSGPAQPAVPVIVERARRGGGGAVREPGLTPLSDNGPFTSVLVDCRGLGVEAIMSPKLMDTTGHEVYGTIRVSPEYAIETGIVGYPRTMGDALRSARAGSHPLIVRALRVGDKFRFNPVISLEDADRIITANGRDRFLEQTRVIFLVDPVR